MEGYIFDWANLLLRWAHVITAIAWIGSSFYFVWLDNSLQKPVDPDLVAPVSAGLRQAAGLSQEFSAGDAVGDLQAFLRRYRDSVK